MVGTVPRSLADWMWPFVRCFTGATWDHVLVLVAGALLSPGRRTVSAALRVMGLDQSASFAVYHRVLSTARWSAGAWPFAAWPERPPNASEPSYHLL